MGSLEHLPYPRHPQGDAASLQLVPAAPFVPHPGARQTSTRHTYAGPGAGCQELRNKGDRQSSSVGGPARGGFTRCWSLGGEDPTGSHWLSG